MKLRNPQSSVKFMFSSSVQYPYFSLFSLHKRFLSNCPKLCIIGSGPSAFYTAQFLLKKHETVQVDMFEKLPAPFGLVRYGVAPDHPEVKVNIIKTFTEVAKNSRFAYFGNVSIGKDIKLKELHKAYSAIIFAYGAAVDKHLNIPGENLSGVLSAKDLVGWYNGVPNHNHFTPDLDCETAVIVGMGNVSIDVARILLSPVNRLKHTDIPEPVISSLCKSRIRRVIMIGRRGPLHVAFTLKEIRELSRLQMMENSLKTSCLITNFLPPNVFQHTIGSDQQIQSVIEGLPRPRRRLTQFLFELATSKTPHRSSPHNDRICDFLFLRAPLEIFPKSTTPTKPNQSAVDRIKLAVTKLEGPPSPDQRSTIDPHSPFEYLDCGMVVRSVGYRGLSIDPDLPFDVDRGVIRCKDDEGRVADLAPGTIDFHPSSMYCTGWIKRGAVGVILDTAVDARNTAKSILDDLEKMESEGSSHMHEKEGFGLIKRILQERDIRPVTFEDWEKVDNAEKMAGQALGKPREKLTTVQSLLRAAFNEVSQHKLNLR